MTLVAGFRSRNGGVLLCTDREEGDGYSKRSVDKVVTINLQQGKVYIAEAGPTSIIMKVCQAFDVALREAEAAGSDLSKSHVELLEDSRESTYARYVKEP